MDIDLTNLPDDVTELHEIISSLSNKQGHEKRDRRRFGDSKEALRKK